MAVISIWIGVVVALHTVAGHAKPAPAVRTHARTAAIVQRAPMVTHEADLDVEALRRHVTAVAKLVGHPAQQLVDALGKAASVGDGMVEWNLSDLGIAAGGTYGYASVVRGKITGVFFRGRADVDVLAHLKLPHGLQLTEAGGDDPAFSIVAGE